MIRLLVSSRAGLNVLAALLAVAALPLPVGGDAGWLSSPLLTSSLLLTLIANMTQALRGHRNVTDGWFLTIAVAYGAFAMLYHLHALGLAGAASRGFWIFGLALWATAWQAIDIVAGYRSLHTILQRIANILVPVLFGLWLLFLWEVIVIGFGVPKVLLPAPSAIVAALFRSTDVLWVDFRQTILKSVLAGYLMGCASGFLIAVLVDRVPFLRRGLLPIGNLVSALPIIGVAPIMVMWFGFDWHSKAAVVVIMTFFPMLVNTVAGLAASDMQQRELLQSYAAGYWQTLVKLRLPAAMPFIFNALKINSTLALIGAIVAEFFGTPIYGIGFRITTEVGRLAIDMAWAEIVMAAVAGSLFYGIVALAERAVTFWHPSIRGA